MNSLKCSYFVLLAAQVFTVRKGLKSTLLKFHGVMARKYSSYHSIVVFSSVKIHRYEASPAETKKGDRMSDQRFVSANVQTYPLGM